MVSPCFVKSVRQKNTKFQLEKQPPILSARQNGPRNLWCFLRQPPPASCRLIQKPPSEFIRRSQKLVGDSFDQMSLLWPDTLQDLLAESSCCSQCWRPKQSLLPAGWSRRLRAPPSISIRFQQILPLWPHVLAKLFSKKKKIRTLNTRESTTNFRPRPLQR